MHTLSSVEVCATCVPFGIMRVIVPFNDGHIVFALRSGATHSPFVTDFIPYPSHLHRQCHNPDRLDHAIAYPPRGAGGE